MREFRLIDKFKGYIAKADVTNVPSGFLVSPSKNVIINDQEKVQAVKGFTLLGAASSAVTEIESSHTWNTSTGTELPLRSYDDELEFYYSSAWRRLADGFSAVDFVFAEFWDSTEKIDMLLSVNGDSNIRMWSGGVTTFSSATVNTITKEGTPTWAEARFLTAGTRQVIIGGITYTYTGGESTTTLTGVTPDPTGGGHAAGAVVHQALRVTANTPSSTVSNDIIAVHDNQVFVGDTTQRITYISKNTSYTDYTYTATRLPGEGALLTLDSPPVAFVSFGKDMFISGTKNEWYKVRFTLSDDTTKEQAVIEKLKSAPLQGARTQGAVGNIQNDVVFISNEPAIQLLGNIADYTQIRNLPLSDPIKSDIESYTYTVSGHVKYFRNQIHVTIPSSSVWLTYDLNRGYWQPPRTASFSRFEIIDGELHAHSSVAPETYKLFNGYNDNEAPINSNVSFSYQHFGKRFSKKNFDEYYIEGYISSGTVLVAGIKYDFGGFTSIVEYDIEGDNNDILFSTISDGSLGKNPIGNQPIGTVTDSISDLPKFRVVFTGLQQDFYEVQFFFESNEVDSQWEILAFGPNARLSGNDNHPIKI